MPIKHPHNPIIQFRVSTYLRIFRPFALLVLQSIDYDIHLYLTILRLGVHGLQTLCPPYRGGSASAAFKERLTRSFTSHLSWWSCLIESARMVMKRGMSYSAFGRMCWLGSTSEGVGLHSFPPYKAAWLYFGKSLHKSVMESCIYDDWPLSTVHDEPFRMRCIICSGLYEV